MKSAAEPVSSGGDEQIESTGRDTLEFDDVRSNITDLFQEQSNAFQAKLNAMKLTPDAPGYLLSMDLLKQFKSGAQKDSPPSQIKNVSLKRKKELRPNMVRGKEYMVVDYEIWTFLHGLFKGGPELSVPTSRTASPSFIRRAFT